MTKMRRNLLMIAAIALTSSALSFFPPSSASAEQSCPYMHFACPDEQFDCCCTKGVRCDLSSEQCDLWCTGQAPWL
jgi:hypothetical protein